MSVSFRPIKTNLTPVNVVGIDGDAVASVRPGHRSHPRSRRGLTCVGLGFEC